MPHLIYAFKKIIVLVLLLIVINPSGARAHFQLNLNVRIIHIEHLSDGLRLYVRMPMPYLVADLVGPLQSDGLPKPAPFTTNKMVAGTLVHFVDWLALERDPLELGSIAKKGIDLRHAENVLNAEVQFTNVYPIGSQPKFATLDEAKAAFVNSADRRNNSKPVYVGDAIVDLVLKYNTSEPISSYSLSMQFDPKLEGQEQTANLILDHAPGRTQVFRSRGLLNEPISISRSAWAAMITFVQEGIRHILEGTDHVLFVLCLVIGAVRLKSLAWRVTGFTIGHSVTLTAGFFGFVPSGAWFIPTVETGIALSIIYAAALAVMPESNHNNRERDLFLVTIAIGLLHGLGFSFVLHEILRVDSPNIWQSLAAFNIGVEIGQLIIVLIIWPTLYFINYISKTTWRMSRYGIAAGSTLIALFWTGERVLSIIETL